MSIISEKVLNKIKAEKLEPKPRWRFQLRDSGRWLGLVFLAIIAVAAVGLLMYFWSDGPWLHGGRFGFGLLFGRMPLILIGIFILGGIMALFNFRNTGRGYRLPVKAVGLALIVIIVFFGWLFYYLGLGRGLDLAIGNTPFYQDRQMYMMQVWQNPNEGLVAGKITKIVDEQSFIVDDFAGKQWTVDATGAVWRHNLRSALGLEIKLIGSANGENFKADEIRPWMGNGGCGMMQGPVGASSCGMMR